MSARLGNCGFNYYCGPSYGEDVCSCQAGYADTYNAAACVDGSTSGSYCSTGGGTCRPAASRVANDMFAVSFRDAIYF